MSIVYHLGVKALECAEKEGSLSTVVKSVSWDLTATDGRFSAQYASATSLGGPNIASFVAYEDLTQEKVSNWIETNCSEEIELAKAGLAGQIAKMKENPIVSPELPWAEKPVFDPTSVEQAPPLFAPDFGTED
jgi:hypothetical protein